MLPTQVFERSASSAAGRLNAIRHVLFQEVSLPKQRHGNGFSPPIPLSFFFRKHKTCFRIMVTSWSRFLKHSAKKMTSKAPKEDEENSWEDSGRRHVIFPKGKSTEIHAFRCFQRMNLLSNLTRAGKKTHSQRVLPRKRQMWPKRVAYAPLDSFNRPLQGY